MFYVLALSLSLSLSECFSVCDVSLKLTFSDHIKATPLTDECSDSRGKLTLCGVTLRCISRDVI